MMLHRMKYLLKIPLLAISVACNRSAQEIKMIVPQSPIPLTLPTHTPPSHTVENNPLHSPDSRDAPPLHSLLLPSLQTFAASSSDVFSP